MTDSTCKKQKYATFRFKYRSPAILRSLFNNVDDDDDDVNPGVSAKAKAKAKAREKASVTETAARKQELLHLPQSELVDRMLKLQTRMERGRSIGHGRDRDRKGEKERRRSGSWKTEGVARGLTEEWVKGQSQGMGMGG